MATAKVSEPIEIGRGFFVYANHNDPSIFRRFWGAAAYVLPSFAALTLERYWSPLRPSSPTLVLLSGPLLRSVDGHSKGIGMTDQNGFRLTFATGALNALDEVLGRDLMLHELAHAHTFAELHFGTIEPSERHRIEQVLTDPQSLNTLMEDLADSRMRSWGIAPEGIREWTNRYVNGLVS